MGWLCHGRIPASALISAVPFGMELMEFAARWYHGGGKAMLPAQAY